MPCMGPNLDWHAEQGRKVGLEILEKMLTEHKMWGPISKNDWSRDNVDWNNAKQNFVKAVEELFVLDGVYSF